MTPNPLRALCLALCLLCLPPALSAAEGSLPRTATFTEGMQRQDGLLPLVVDAASGKVYLELSRFDEELLYVTTLTQGLGSNDVGLDRGQLGDTRRVHFERVGTRVLMLESNLRFRADDAQAAEREAVAQSFADTVLFGFDVVAEQGAAVLVDATPFVVRDAHGIAERLAATEQGTFSLDASRSAPVPAHLKAFPRNVELEARLTFTGSEPGDYVKDVAPDPGAVTVRQRISLIAAPEPGYVPRPHVPGDGYFGLDYLDYAAELGTPMRRQFIARHRLQKTDPQAEISDVVEPIVYYLDRGAPEPIRSALLEGARWWAEAFEAAGFRDAFRVELLPEGADPMDVRYNVIQWVHRATRGWSYGSAVVDPLTGEIVKGNVTLGSLRVRYDYLLAEGLLSPYTSPDAEPDAMRELALARLRQLSAHEVGHTLGLDHNFIASTQDRASVMDYPVPKIGLGEDGELDLSSVYDTGIGEWDIAAITYGYAEDGRTETPAGALAALRRLNAAGLSFINDADARAASAALPAASLWDNGVDVTAQLDHVMRVRAHALARFGDNAIRFGMPLATLEEALVPVYLYHRYQIDAAAKALGGQTYRYVLRGDGGWVSEPIAPEAQRAALAALLRTLDPDALMLPPALLARIAPRPPGYDAHRELFTRSTGPIFDPLAGPSAASALTVEALLQPERAARLVLQHALDADQPDLAEVIDALVDHAFGDAPENGYAREILHAQQIVLLRQLMALAEDASLPQVRAEALLALDGIADDSTPRRRGQDADAAQRRYVADAIARFKRRAPGDDGALPKAPDLPPGSPLG